MFLNQSVFLTLSEVFIYSAFEVEVAHIYLLDIQYI